MKRKNTLILSSLLLLTLSGCSSTGTNSSSANSGKVIQYISAVSSDGRTTLSIGETTQLEVTVYGVTSSEVTYTSENNVLSVSSTGLVEALRAGNGVITIASVADTSLTTTFTITVVETITDQNSQIAEFIDSMKSYDYESGVAFDSDISLTLKAGISGSTLFRNIPITMSVPLLTEVQKTSEETYVHAQTSFQDCLSLSSLGSFTGDNGFTKLLANALCPDFEDYLTWDEDYEDIQHLDIYNFGSTDYYVGLTRNFASNDERTYALSSNSATSLLSPVLALLLASSGITGTGSSSSLDITSFFNSDSWLSLSSTIYGYLDVLETSDSTTLSLSGEILNILNSYYKSADFAKEFSYTFTESTTGASTTLDISLPTSFSSITVTINNKASGENKFSGLTFAIDGYDSNNNTYNFLTYTMDQPTVYESGVMATKKAETQNYVTAMSSSITDASGNTTTIEDLIKDAETYYDAVTKYGADSTTAANVAVYNNFINTYNNASTSVQNLLYPMMTRLNKLS